MIEPDKLSFNNAFFADTIFLVEGYTDEIFLKYIFQNKNPNKAIEDFNISIVNCSSKDSIVKFYNIYKEGLGIKCFVLYDKDQTLPTKDKEGKEYTKESIASQAKQRNSNNEKLEKYDGYGFEENLEYFLTGELKHHLDNDKKRNIVKKWLENPNQEKVNEIWNIITSKIPELKQSL
jgi:predicted ATP-dependent endonuclease of OLD family